MRFLFILFLFAINPVLVQAQTVLNGFNQWRTGHDEATVQLVPANGTDALVSLKGDVVAWAKFKVKGYGEMSFPIDPSTQEGEEAKKVDLSKSSFVRIRYKATHNLILQLRQTGVHGGVHNQVTLNASRKFITRVVHFNEFKGGKTPLDISDVAKFNFAFLGSRDGVPYDAELVVKGFEIENYKP